MSEPAPLAPADYVEIVRRALAEDVGPGDVTTNSTVAATIHGHGVLLAKSALVVAGLEVARAVFVAVGGETAIRFAPRIREGEFVDAGTALAEVDGPAGALLTAERTALNLLQRMSGIATTTRAYVRTAAGRITILDTRKTTPMLRALEKYAVRVGGGTNHRFGLYDQVLIKDNHVRIAGGVRRAVELARRRGPGLAIEVEAQTVAEAAEAADVGADIVLLDNLTTPEIREAVARIAGRARTEVSGGVTLARIPELAETGADAVSVGALTHSVVAADISFEVEARETS
jgi:nicotinate-nucleotide pyrophosphorylase (carboxylating)